MKKIIIRIIAYGFLGFCVFFLLLSFYIFAYSENSKYFHSNYKNICENSKENILIAAGFPSAVWGLENFANILANNNKHNVYIFNSNSYYCHMRYCQREYYEDKLMTGLEIESLKALALIAYMDANGIKKVDSFILYSEGAMYGAIAATMFPERFGRIVVIDGAGTTKINLRQYNRNFLKVLLKYVFGSNREMARVCMQEYALILFNDFGLVNGIIAELLNYNLYFQLYDIKDKVVIFHGEKDALYPFSKAQKRAKEHGYKIKKIEGAGHFSPILKSLEIANMVLASQ